MKQSFEQLISTWPVLEGLTSVGAFAVDIGTSYDHANTMKQRNSIPPDWWARVLAAAKRRKVRLTEGDLVRLREEARKAKRQRPKRRPVAPRSAHVVRP